MILERIIRHKKKELVRAKIKTPLASLQDLVRRLPRRKKTFYRALLAKRPVAVIAEIKRRSPSKGLLRKRLDPAAVAKAYVSAGAAAVSVLTDRKFFGGSDADLRAVRRAVGVPILRKDFIIDEYQVYEARLIGADAVLLIAAVLSRAKLRRLAALADRLGMDTLFEVHTAAELRKTAPLKPRLLGVNNRDLRTFVTDLGTTARLAKLCPKGSLLVSESGIQTHADLIYLKNLGARAVLVGEGLLRQADVRVALRKLIRG